jgi:hypothetical protein
MKRPIAAFVATVVFALVLLSQTTSLTALVSPVAKPNGALPFFISPLSPPTAYDPLYRANPRTITAHPVPFVNWAGETIVQEYIYQQPHRDPLVVDVKAQPALQAAPVQLTFQSPLGGQYPYQVYMPIVSKPANAKVLAIAYMGETAWNDPVWLANQQIAHIARGTSFHGVGESSIGFELAGGAVNIVNSYPPTSTTYWGYMNLNAIYQQFNICSRVISEGINEVWIYADGKPNGHVYAGTEWLENGPVWSVLYGAPIDPPNCGKQVFTMLYNFDVGDANELESWVHSAEWSFMFYPSSGTQSCDVGHPGNYGAWGSWWDSGCSGLGYSDINAFTALPGAANGNVGVCGDAHFPPNIPANLAWPLPNPNAYIYNSPNTYPSRCTDWQWNILTNTVPVSGGTWGNTEVGYLQWWMQNVPGKNNNLRGRDGSLRPNWWDFRLKR